MLRKASLLGEIITYQTLPKSGISRFPQKCIISPGTGREQGEDCGGCLSILTLYQVFVVAGGGVAFFFLELPVRLRTPYQIIYKDIHTHLGQPSLNKSLICLKQQQLDLVSSHVKWQLFKSRESTSIIFLKMTSSSFLYISQAVNK